MRKHFFVFTFLCFSVFAHAQTIDVTRYLFSIEVGDNDDSVRGETGIFFLTKTQDSGISLDLSTINSHGNGMVVDSVNDANGKRLKFKHENDKLRVYLHDIVKDTTQFVSIAYHGIPDDGLIISKNKYGDRTFFADNWPNRAHHWLPCNDRPDDKALFEFWVIAPKEYQVISNGENVFAHKELNAEEHFNETGKSVWHWQEDTPLPTKVMVIGVAKFATKVFDDSPKGIPISAWVYPQDSTKGFYDYALATDILKFFSSYIAPYPYNKLANVQSKTIFGGMENASCIFYAEESVTGDRSSEDLLAHEIAHQWFGDMATEKSFAHLWLSEGFATYFTDLYFEHKYGREAFLKRLKKERDEAIAFAKNSTHPVVDTTSNLMSLLNANSYQKGAWVLHMLRSEVGDSVFHKIIQSYYSQYKGSNADTRDFEAVAEKVSGKDLKWFFDQWLYQAGLSKVAAKWKQEDGKIKILISRSGAINQKILLWILTRYADGTTAKHGIELKPGNLNTDFSYTETNRAVAIELDPEMKLLFEYSISKEK